MSEGLRDAKFSRLRLASPLSDKLQLLGWWPAGVSQKSFLTRTPAQELSIVFLSEQSDPGVALQPGLSRRRDRFIRGPRSADAAAGNFERRYSELPVTETDDKTLAVMCQMMVLHGRVGLLDRT